jgi:hypothetical protein
MNQSFSCRYGPIQHGTILFYLLEKYLKKFFVLPTVPSKNSSDHHNSNNKGPMLAFFRFLESPSNSLLTIKFRKTHITSSHSNMPKTTMTEIWSLLGFRGYIHTFEIYRTTIKVEVCIVYLLLKFS